MSRRTAWRLAREQGWESTYDAEYLAVTRLQADALVTVDPALATKAKGFVPLADLDALSADGHRRSQRADFTHAALRTRTLPPRRQM